MNTVEQFRKRVHVITPLPPPISRRGSIGGFQREGMWVAVEETRLSVEHLVSKLLLRHVSLFLHLELLFSLVFPTHSRALDSVLLLWRYKKTVYFGFMLGEVTPRHLLWSSGQSSWLHNGDVL
jgi:hypothetical protein